ncbi:MULTISPECIES: hypothetical protein [unclassified Streptomyces]|uniref:hypothetical protein n=1 Tax=unclassified Streptomyces TaxID=2593676 RepID=UPI002DDBD2E4|nr:MULTISPECIES: hypothetical protein [unclassified Streptomyces]WSA95140.1 hypothetical protein OIE63_28990 [Streptomyces sp. NBC_01795]WSB79562.1 hypothetical protein OHB04_30105 [Streptomyces sp. NBC_01775]WSS12235.1 hypothetical protein OG533_10110 [Streptomyces sp. NBC_01186]WSS40948.1 hypothetical protein OG220_10265 [Streptomyces sp. NBC_01187]
MIAKLSDKLLGMVLREERAGACVPEHGNYCGCKSGYKYALDCNGHCTDKTINRC